MGNTVGAYEEKELEGLSSEQREQLKQEVLRLLHTSPEIRAIIDQQPRMLTRNSDINKILKRELQPTLDKLKK
jgi:hypothetical protein